MSRVCVDSNIWLGYFLGEIKCKDILEDHDTYLSTIGLAEIADFLERNSMDISTYLAFIELRSIIVTITPEIAHLCAIVKTRHRKTRNKFGLSDAIQYACAAKLGYKFITKDYDFRGLKNVQIIN